MTVINELYLPGACNYRELHGRAKLLEEARNYLKAYLDKKAWDCIPWPVCSSCPSKADPCPSMAQPCPSKARPRNDTVCLDSMPPKPEQEQKIRKLSLTHETSTPHEKSQTASQKQKLNVRLIKSPNEVAKYVYNTEK